MSVRLAAFDGDPGVRPSWHAYVDALARAGLDGMARPSRSCRRTMDVGLRIVNSQPEHNLAELD
jgi:hypothetical protein